MGRRWLLLAFGTAVVDGLGVASMVDNPYESPKTTDPSASPEDAIIVRLRAAKRRSAIFNGVAVVVWIAFFGAVLIQFDGKPFWIDWGAWLILFPVAILLAYIGFRAWRCPSCKRLLKGTKNPTFCPECGIRYVSTIDNNARPQGGVR